MHKIWSVMGKRGRHCGFFKMKVLKDVSSGTVEDFAESNVSGDTVLFADSDMAYINLESQVEDHIKVKSSESSTKDDPNWVYTAISNLKKNLLGIYHMVTEKYMQNYLDEFVYKLNRRYFWERWFDRLIIAVIKVPNSQIKFNSHTAQLSLINFLINYTNRFKLTGWGRSIKLLHF